MVYERNSRDRGSRDFDYGRDDDNGRSYGSAAARYGSGYDRDDDGARDYGRQGHGRDERFGGQRDYSRQGYGQQFYGQRDYGQQGYGRQDQRGENREWHGSYGSDGRRFEDVGRYRNADDDDRNGRYGARDRDYGRQPQGYQYEDRGFIARAGDEVRSWFGDDEAERRREADARYDERLDRSGSGRHDDDYRQWRSGQVSQLDRDYHEYRQENRSKFESEFSNWRTARQGQRDSLRQVKEHAEVVGSDGAHVGTVDKVRDDRILLTRNDADAGGHHHSIPSRWISKVEDKTVTLSKTATEAKAAWEDEDRNSAMFNYGDNARSQDRTSADTTGGGRDAQGRVLNRSFSGTY